MKRCNYTWIDFLSGSNVVKVTNENEFNEFRKFLSETGLIEILQGDNHFEDWQKLARINNKKDDLFLFEYQNHKGITWDDDLKSSIEWYDKEPINVSELNEFFEKRNETKFIESENDLEYDIE